MILKDKTKLFFVKTQNNFSPRSNKKSYKGFEVIVKLTIFFQMFFLGTEFPKILDR